LSFEASRQKSGATSPLAKINRLLKRFYDFLIAKY
jgi:hypothetical protein